MAPRALGPPLGLTDLALGSDLASGARELRRLRAWHRAAPADLTAAQHERLRDVVRHAGTSAPFWRRHLDGATAASLHDLPTTDKNELRRHPMDDLLAGPRPDRARVVRTSGSSGVPFTVLYPPGFARWQGLLRARMDLARGIPPWARRAGVVFSSDPRAGGGLLGRARRRREQIPMTLPLDEVRRRLAAARPHVLGGHPQVLVDVGDGLDGRVRPRVVSTYGEAADDTTRRALRRMFGAPSLDGYGVAEVGHVAWQCADADLYHVNHEAVIVEVLGAGDRPVAPGEVGEVVVTGLANPLMPFIRYRLGDTATVAGRPCRCGYALPAIASIEGRTMDWIESASGTRIAPQRLWLSNHADPALIERLQRYQVAQSADRSIEVRLVLAGEPEPGALAALERSYRAVVGDGVDVRVRRVDAIPTDPSGKFRLVRSDVAGRGPAGSGRCPGG